MLRRRKRAKVRFFPDNNPSPIVLNMFPQKTVLVIGAGASHEFGLPLGSQLIAEVQRALDFRWTKGQQTGSGDGYTLDALGRLAKAKGIERNDYTRACGQLRSGISAFLSIDNYLHSHSDNAQLVESGKVGIARSILAAEGRSTLKLDPYKGEKFSVDKIVKTWIYPFIRILNANVKRKEIEKIFNNIAIICFNYDRCIEHTFHELIQISFSVDFDTATKCMNNLSIIHPYGTVGPLPWQDQDKAIPFGNFERNDLDIISKQISLFTEQREDKIFNDFIDTHVTTAEKIMFIGYGYYSQNMDLITRQLNQNALIAGTAKGLSRADIDAIKGDLQRRFTVLNRGPIDTPLLEDMTCLEMLDSYSRFLAAI